MLQSEIYPLGVAVSSKRFKHYKPDFRDTTNKDINEQIDQAAAN